MPPTRKSTCGGEHDAPHESGSNPAFEAPATVTFLPNTLPPLSAWKAATKHASAPLQFLAAPSSRSYVVPDGPPEGYRCLASSDIELGSSTGGACGAAL